MLSLDLDTNFIWLDIEIWKNWYDDKTMNRKFFEELISADFGEKSIGIYTSLHNWETLMGLDYTKGSSYPLWYARYDNQPNFQDFKPFAGWLKPQIKQFSGDQSICGVGVDLNYKEESTSY